MGISRLPPVDRRPKWLVALLEMAIEPTAIGLVSLNSNSETHMTVICNARHFNEHFLNILNFSIF